MTTENIEQIENIEQPTEKVNVDKPADKSPTELAIEKIMGDKVEEENVEEQENEHKSSKVENAEKEMPTDLEAELEKELTEDELIQEVKSPRGQARVKEIISKYKEADGELKNIVSMVRETGSTADQFTGMIAMLKMINSPNPQDNKEALNIISQMQQELAKRTGTPIGDVLEGYDDIKKAVEDLSITPEMANELAKSRRAQQAQEYQNKIHSERNQQLASQQQSQQRMQQAQIEVNRITNYFNAKQNDIDFAEKIAEVKRIMNDTKELNKFLDTYQPHQWLPAMELIYNSTKVTKPKGNNTPIIQTAIKKGGLTGMRNEGNSPTKLAMEKLGL